MILLGNCIANTLSTPTGENYSSALGLGPARCSSFCPWTSKTLKYLFNFEHLVVPLTSIGLHTCMKLSTYLSALLDTAISTLQNQAANNLAREWGQASDVLEWSNEDYLTITSKWRLTPLIFVRVFVFVKNQLPYRRLCHQGCWIAESLYNPAQ